jgi:hypothetical protein
MLSWSEPRKPFVISTLADFIYRGHDITAKWSGTLSMTVDNTVKSDTFAGLLV